MNYSVNGVGIIGYLANYCIYHVLNFTNSKTIKILKDDKIMYNQDFLCMTEKA